ncbi:hypothetical protein NDU88_002762 [Pleurodeles waltl]|uniref:Uncharacterized protein n=1 Tax=Pleurodeles waltl TaxID=8319 RepID=A0AAV7NIU2_PLEWA|nr:hypothetical protein NDU88_002762 [Pleurodeles waltl]
MSSLRRAWPGAHGVRIRWTELRPEVPRLHSSGPTSFTTCAPTRPLKFQERGERRELPNNSGGWSRRQFETRAAAWPSDLKMADGMDPNAESEAFGRR